MKLKEMQIERARKNENSKFATFCDRFGFESQQFKSIKSKLKRILSVEKIINNLVQLINFKAYMEESNDLYYIGEGLDITQ
jgi:predicted AAA+ superfamily ATPase